MDIARWGLGVKYPTQGQRHRRPLHVRRRPGDAEHPDRHVRVRRRRQEEMMVFEVRHWMTNHEAGIGEGKARRTRTPSATCSTAPRDTWPSTATAATRRSSAGSRNPARRGRKGGRQLGEFHPGGAQPQAVGPERPRSKRAPLHAHWCTWRTSPTGWAARCTSTPQTLELQGDTEANRDVHPAVPGAIRGPAEGLMRRRHFLALLPAALCADTEEGFVSLFDGRSLHGWSIREGPGSAFYVKDGAIVVHDPPISPPGSVRKSSTKISISAANFTSRAG